MQIFNNRVSEETKLDCVQRMLFNHVIDLKRVRKEFNDIYLQQFYRLLKLRKTLLSRILAELERYEKVVVRFDCKREGIIQSIEFGVFHADDCRWDDLFNGLEGNQSGLCITFCFDGNKDISPWYFCSERDLRGSVLSKVFDIK